MNTRTFVIVMALVLAWRSRAADCKRGDGGSLKNGAEGGSTQRGDGGPHAH